MYKYVEIFKNGPLRAPAFSNITYFSEAKV